MDQTLGENQAECSKINGGTYTSEIDTEDTVTRRNHTKPVEDGTGGRITSQLERGSDIFRQSRISRQINSAFGFLDDQLDDVDNNYEESDKLGGTAESHVQKSQSTLKQNSCTDNTPVIEQIRPPQPGLDKSNSAEVLPLSDRHPSQNGVKHDYTSGNGSLDTELRSSSEEHGGKPVSLNHEPPVKSPLRPVINQQSLPKLSAPDVVKHSNTNCDKIVEVADNEVRPSIGTVNGEETQVPPGELAPVLPPGERAPVLPPVMAPGEHTKDSTESTQSATAGAGRDFNNLDESEGGCASQNNSSQSGHLAVHASCGTGTCPPGDMSVTQRAPLENLQSQQTTSLGSDSLNTKSLDASQNKENNENHQAFGNGVTSDDREIEKTGDVNAEKALNVSGTRIMDTTQSQEVALPVVRRLKSTKAMSRSQESLEGIVLADGQGRAVESPSKSSDETDDEDEGMYVESYRSSRWVYTGENGDISLLPPGGENTVPNEDGHTEEEVPVENRVQNFLLNSSHLESINEDEIFDGEDIGPMVSPLQRLHDRFGSVGSESVASDTSTTSERDFRRRHQAVSRKYVQRKSSTQAYHRISQRYYETDKMLTVVKRPGDVDFGFHFQGSHPPVVSTLKSGGAAEAAGLEVGDLITCINGVDIMACTHSECLQLLQSNSDSVDLEITSASNNNLPYHVGSRDSKVPMLTGYLLKQSSNYIKSWKKRWFVLKQDNCLYYYKTEKEKDPLGAILLSNYTITKATDIHKRHAFKALKYGSRTYYFVAQSEEEMSRWADALNQAAQTSNKMDTWIDVSSQNVDLPALSIKNPDCHGYLHKLGTNRHKWQKRYFVLKDACMYYYTDVASNTAKVVDSQWKDGWADALNQAAQTSNKMDTWIDVSSQNVDLPALSIKNPDCHGYLHKLGTNRHKWQKRYFVLKDACMYYYTDVASNTAKGVSHLHGYTVDENPKVGKKFSIGLIPPETRMRSFYFCAEKAFDKDRWVAALRTSIGRWVKAD
ncbi:uncharacterized protein LOC106176737 [Lingula anatina]|uniref:Uncharacterized protein LOC106176737 n=1 Tax=Lingula anatina TaxID=7574 RepID=A0A2R2MNK1_LINAN|nr:uncharacterized protein LOC106176737 [Lingula anatina]|eukprot:XP_023931803.1 uncharacterized protein LOC106176737 [Lingula anatina]